MTARKTAVATTTTIAATNAFDFPLGARVRVNLAGRVVGRSEFLEGGDSYLVEHERRGKVVREWIVADKLVAEAGE